MCENNEKSRIKAKLVINFGLRFDKISKGKIYYLRSQAFYLRACVIIFARFIIAAFILTA